MLGHSILLALASLSLSLPTSEGPAQPAQAGWTLLVYGGADNNADGPLQRFLDDLRKSIDDDPGVELVLFIDRSPGFSDEASLLGEDFSGARLYRLHKDSVERLPGGPELPEVGLTGDTELDFADATTLGRFIAWGKRSFPARKTGLLIYSHADGQSMCPDETSERSMGISELTNELGPQHSLDFLALELCNMGGIEISYEWRPGGAEEPRFGADVLVAIPNAGPPLDWDRAFARVRSKGHASPSQAPTLDPATMSAEELGSLVVEEGRRGREAAEQSGRRVAHEAAACYDLREAAVVKRAVDALACALAKNELREAFATLRDPETPSPLMNFNEEGPYVDLFDMAMRLAQDEAFGDDVRKAAEDVLGGVDRFVVASFGMSGYADFEPGKNGVFIVLPESEPGSWSHFGWYTPRSLEQGEGSGKWAFLADGSTAGNGVIETWFELLDAWYDETDERGGLNGYRW